jgi:hypothetical protein
MELASIANQEQSVSQQNKLCSNQEPTVTVDGGSLLFDPVKS